MANEVSLGQAMRMLNVRAGQDWPHPTAIQTDVTLLRYMVDGQQLIIVDVPETPQEFWLLGGKVKLGDLIGRVKEHTVQVDRTVEPHPTMVTQVTVAHTCIRNPGETAYSVYVRQGPTLLRTRTYYNEYSHTYRTEVQGILDGLCMLAGQHKLEIRVPSRTTLKPLREWLTKWVVDDFSKRGSSGRVKNEDLWRNIAAELKHHDWTAVLAPNIGDMLEARVLARDTLMEGTTSKNAREIGNLQGKNVDVSRIIAQAVRDTSPVSKRFAEQEKTVNPEQD